MLFRHLPGLCGIRGIRGIKMKKPEAPPLIRPEFCKRLYVLAIYLI